MKFWRLIGAAAVMAVMLAACGEAEAPPEDTQAEDTQAVEGVAITSAGVSDYYIIRSDFAQGSEVDSAVALRKGMMDASGAEIGISTDWEKNPVYDHEIIVGKTERDGYEIDKAALGETGYVIKEVDGDVYICGGDDPGLALAVEYFLREFVKTGSDIVIPAGFERIVYHQFDIPALYVDMNLVDKSWKIVVPEDNTRASGKIMEAAEKLKAVIADKCGFELSIVTGGESVSKAFILSGTQPEMKGVHTIHVDGDRLILRSSASSGVADCVNRFISMYFKEETRGKFNFPGDYEYLELGDYMIVTYPAEQ